MSKICIVCSQVSMIDFVCDHSYCFDCYYESSSEILINLAYYIIFSPESLNGYSGFGCPFGCQISICTVAPSILWKIIRTKPDLNETLKKLFYFLLKYCQNYLSGITTTFVKCQQCNSLKITSNDGLVFCGCDPEFLNKYNEYLSNYYILSNFNIKAANSWDGCIKNSIPVFDTSTDYYKTLNNPIPVNEEKKTRSPKFKITLRHFLPSSLFL